MDIRHLEYILALAETGNMTRAAHKLFISQPTLSQFLTKQEQELGTPLFQRVGGIYELTPAGTLYAEYAKKVMTLTATLDKDMKRISNSSRIRIGTAASRALQMLTSILGKFREYYPNIELIMSDDNFHAMRGAIARGELDLAFITADTLDPFKNQSLELKREEVVFAAPSQHPYCQKVEKGRMPRLNSTQLIEAFHTTPFILQRKGSCIRYLVEDFFGHQDFVPTIACSTNHAQSICDMVASNIGVGFIPKGYSIPSHNIVYYHLDPPMHRIHSVIYRKDMILEPQHKFLFQLARGYVAENWKGL